MSSHRYFGAETLRQKWHNPEITLKDIGLRSGMVFMDIGCGDGFFAIPAAQLVGEKGLVYAVDIDASAVERLKDKAAKRGLRNLTLKLERLKKQFSVKNAPTSSSTAECSTTSENQQKFCKTPSECSNLLER